MIGRVIANRYRITAQLGAGGMGSVWRADHLALGSPIAIKLIDDALVDNADILARFEREAQAAASLRSPHVVQVLDYGVDDGTPFIAMELLDGESLEDRLVREGSLPHADTVRILTQVARAVGKAHEAGIVHRDLKPANIFLVRNDDEEVAKVLDFGIAKSERTAISSTRTGTMMGTPGYMSPEQAQGTKNVDARTDLWALGAIAYECVCGRPVFMGDALGDIILQICVKPLPVPSAAAAVPAGFDAWFARALNRDIDDRFQSAKELADGLRAVLESGADAGARSQPFAATIAAPVIASAPTPAPRGGAVGDTTFSGTVGSFARTNPVTSVPGVPKARPRRAFAIGAVALVLAAVGAFAMRSGPREEVAPAASSRFEAPAPTETSNEPAKATAPTEPTIAAAAIATASATSTAPAPPPAAAPSIAARRTPTRPTSAPAPAARPNRVSAPKSEDRVGF